MKPIWKISDGSLSGWTQILFGDACQSPKPEIIVPSVVIRTGSRRDRLFGLLAIELEHRIGQVEANQNRVQSQLFWGTDDQMASKSAVGRAENRRQRVQPGASLTF